jgi:putative ABC transport system permease protein
VGEVRGAEAVDMLQAMNTGHDGSMCTGHANSAQDMMYRLENMVLTGIDIPLEAIKSQIGAAIDIVVHLGRLRDKTRKVMTIHEMVKDENEKIKSLDKIADTLPSYMKTVEITSIQNSQTINLVVPEQSDKLDEFIGLRNRKHKKETYTLDDDSVIISEKIASLLKIKVGDTITIKNTDDIEKDVKVGAITENYIYHYMYMSSNLYNKLYGENSFKPNTLLIKEAEGTTEDDEDNIGKIILQDDTTVAGVSFLSGTKDIFVTVMEQMQLVVYVLIISAGLLAFAVLYNLSNVNISERIRELATIKVLGFYNKEVFNYITKETRILTVIGIFFGLFGGYFLSMYAVKTCELDMMMFNYEISKMCFIYGIIITIMFAEIVNLAVNRTLKKISMTESLKSVD